MAKLLSRPCGDASALYHAILLYHKKHEKASVKNEKRKSDDITITGMTMLLIWWLMAKAHSLIGRIKGFMKSFVTKLKQAFNDVGTAHDEASKLMSKVAKEFQEKWDFALEEAVETARKSEKVRSLLQRCRRSLQSGIKTGQKNVLVLQPMKKTG